MKEFAILFFQLLDKVPITLFILIVSVFFSLILGVIVALVRIRKRPVSYIIATFYLSFARCTPALVQLFLVYFGLPKLLSIININISDWDRIVFVIITFSLHNAAALSEVMRSAYISVGNNQLEAAFSVGMSYSQALRRIILPQAFVIALPNLGNNFIMLLKDTSLAFTIGIVDMMGQVSIITGNNYGIGLFKIYVVISIIYWIICIGMESGLNYLEKSLTKTKLIGR